MIVDGPITFDLTVGADRRIPEQADAQTVVPPTVLPVVLALKPTTLSNGGGLTITRSTFFDVALSRTNQAAAILAMAVLAPGLWELEMTLTSQFDFAGAFGTVNGAAISLLDQIGVTVRPLTRSAAAGSFTDYNRVRILLLAPLTLNLEVAITTVGQHLDARAAVNCIRIL